jgi:hypothetical protein
LSISDGVPGLWGGIRFVEPVGQVHANFHGSFLKITVDGASARGGRAAVSAAADAQPEARLFRRNAVVRRSLRLFAFVSRRYLSLLFAEGPLSPKPSRPAASFPDQLYVGIRGLAELMQN